MSKNKNAHVKFLRIIFGFLKMKILGRFQNRCQKNINWLYYVVIYRLKWDISSISGSCKILDALGLFQKMVRLCWLDNIQNISIHTNAHSFAFFTHKCLQYILKYTDRAFIVLHNYCSLVVVDVVRGPYFSRQHFVQKLLKSRQTKFVRKQHKNSERLELMFGLVELE